jgi:hypothetical protein
MAEPSASQTARLQDHWLYTEILELQSQASKKELEERQNVTVNGWLSDYNSSESIPPSDMPTKQLSQSPDYTPQPYRPPPTPVFDTPTFHAPTGPKSSRSPAEPINITALCTPHSRALFHWEVLLLRQLQDKVDAAIAGTGPWIKILYNIPGSIQLTMRQKQKVYEAQEKMDVAEFEMGRSGGRTEVRECLGSASNHTTQHGIRTVLTLPHLDVATTKETARLAVRMLEEVNSLLGQIYEGEHVQIAFGAQDFKKLRGC